MKRNATGEWGGKMSKTIGNSTKFITSFLDMDKPEIVYRSRTKDKQSGDIKVGDTVSIKAIRLYSITEADEKKLRSIFSKNSSLFGFNHSIEVQVESLLKEGKLVTYFATYNSIPVRFDNRFTRIFKVL